jgi:acyl-CoA dehydrogenase
VLDVAIEHRYEEIRRRAIAVAELIEPVSAEADDMATVHPTVRRLLSESGLTELVVPRSHGGSSEQIDPYAICVVREVLMSVSSHADALFALQGIGSYAMTCAGTDDQRVEWLPKIASMEALAALALTEPDTGSDLRSVATTATTVDPQTVVLSGHKSFISNAGFASVYTVLAKESAGLSLFVVPADAAGVSTEQGPALAAAHVIGDLILSDVRLPVTARLGAPGQGLAPVLATLSIFRASVAAAAVGLAQTAVNEARDHAMRREAFGRPLIKIGAVAALLADSAADVSSARLMAYRAAELAREDAQAHLGDSSMAKLFATEACSRVVDRCVQVMGRWGLVEGSRIERCYRQARPMRVYEGASELLRLEVARQLSREAALAPLEAVPPHA